MESGPPKRCVWYCSNIWGERLWSVRVAGGVVGIGVDSGTKSGLVAEGSGGVSSVRSIVMGGRGRRAREKREWAVMWLM